ncbi:MAG: hypothetical protein RI996_129 [Candidatus Parcubacteria bacterium]|jgi:hypothetical protein
MTTHTTTDETKKGHPKADLGFFSVYKGAYGHFKKSVVPILALLAFYLLFLGAFVLASGALLFGLYSILPESLIISSILLTLAVVVAIAIIISSIIVSMMNIYLIAHPTYEFRPLLTKAIAAAPNYIIVIAAIGLVQLGGYILFVFPGIWISVVLYFATFIALLESKNTKQTIITSSHLVKNHFWKILLFIISLFVLSLATELILYIGGIVSIFVAIFTLNLGYELYTRLTKHNTIHTIRSVSDTKIVTVSTIFAVLTVVVILAICCSLLFFSTEIGTLISESLLTEEYI